MPLFRYHTTRLSTPTSESVLHEEITPFKGSERELPLLFGVKTDTASLERVLRNVNYMLTAIPKSQHKYYRTLLEHLNRALQRDMRDMIERPLSPQQIQVSRVGLFVTKFSFWSGLFRKSFIVRFNII